jgi:Protein of unknown function (DUF3467)
MLVASGQLPVSSSTGSLVPDHGSRRSASAFLTARGAPPARPPRHSLGGLAPRPSTFLTTTLSLSKRRSGRGRPHATVIPTMNERKQINFTIVPDDSADVPRIYANFCAISHTPFDFTLAFCEVLPLSEKDIQAAEAQHVVRAPVRSKVVVPLQVVPNLIAALQEHMRVYSESTGVTWDAKGPVH